VRLPTAGRRRDRFAYGKKITNMPTAITTSAARIRSKSARWACLRLRYSGLSSEPVMRLHCQSLPVAVEPIPGKFIQYYFGTLYTDAARTARRHTEPACASPITDACPASAFSTSRNAVKKDVVAPGPERREPRQAVARRRGAIDQRSLFVLNPACPRVADIRRLGGSRKTPNPTSS
jgi:hypothetical protein